jgi:RNA polymerase sigma-70 factor (ECF subfamily)
VTERHDTPAATDPDGDLVAAFRAGRASAFDALVTRHGGRIYRLACRILGDPEGAEDAAQEAFVRAWRALGDFQGQARFSTWLTRIAINQCRNELRRRRTRKHAPALSLDGTPPGSDVSPAETLAAGGPAPWQVAEGSETARTLAALFAGLDPEVREILVLSEAEAMSYEEIAELLDVPVGTVRSRLHRARGQVRRRLGGVLESRA